MDKHVWVFTFGVGTNLKGKYALIEGTFDQARSKMMSLFGKEWCMQYKFEEYQSSIDKYELTPIENLEEAGLVYCIQNTCNRILSKSFDDENVNDISSLVINDVVNFIRNNYDFDYSHPASIAAHDYMIANALFEVIKGNIN